MRVSVERACSYAPIQQKRLHNARHQAHPLSTETRMKRVPARNERAVYYGLKMYLMPE